MVTPAEQFNAKEYAPVVLFTYKRLPILKRVVASLLSNEECPRTPLTVYSDGPKTEGDEPAVKETRAYLKVLTGFKSIEFIFRDRNLGLAQSFIQGITETLQRHQQAIFLEDDNLLSKHFLSFINQALDYYKNNEKVICLSGFSFPLKPAPKQPYFLRGAETWSMATWQRGWKYFCADGKKLLADIESQGLTKKFSSDGFGFDRMLKRQINGEIDSWGVRWWTSAFVNDKYCLYPEKPLCVSIGYGSDSVHNASYSPILRRPSDLSDKPIVGLPDAVVEKAEISLAVRRMNQSLAHPSLWRRIINKIAARFKKIIYGQ